MSFRLLTTTRSPFARKVRIALLEKGLAHELVAVDLAQRDAAWFREHPIGKIPVLVLPDGTRIPDSTIICETLEDRFPAPPLYEPDRLRCRILEELADAAGAATVETYFARQAGDAAAEARAQALLDRLLDALAARLSTDWPPGFGIADAALLGTLGYLELRLGPSWRQRHPGLATHADALADRPSVRATVPVA